MLRLHTVTAGKSSIDLVSMEIFVAVDRLMKSTMSPFCWITRGTDKATTTTNQNDLVIGGLVAFRTRGMPCAVALSTNSLTMPLMPVSGSRALFPSNSLSSFSDLKKSTAIATLQTAWLASQNEAIYEVISISLKNVWLNYWSKCPVKVRFTFVVQKKTKSYCM